MEIFVARNNQPLKHAEQMPVRQHIDRRNSIYDNTSTTP